MKEIKKHSWNYKGGEKARECFCIDCNKKLSASAYYKKIKRCCSCTIKNAFKIGLRKYKKKYYCIDCGKELSQNASYKNTKRCNQCSGKCRTGKNHGMYIDGKTLKQYFCLDCGKELKGTNAYKHKRCISCENKTRIGIFSNNWQGGISFEEYPKEFSESLKESIRKRDNYSCQNCGMTEEEHFIVNGCDLHIHHINYDKMNCKESNLITTCLSCNIRANFNRIYWQSFYQSKLIDNLVSL